MRLSLSESWPGSPARDSQNQGSRTATVRVLRKAPRAENAAQVHVADPAPWADFALVTSREVCRTYCTFVQTAPDPNGSVVEVAPLRRAVTPNGQKHARAL
jgi:hypothetical protein